MQSIKLSKLADGVYKPNLIKIYEVSNEGKALGFIAQDVTLNYWQVRDTYFVSLSQHSTIKAAVRKARQVLL